MIKYQLQCRKNHHFEGWFRNSRDFDMQSRRKLVACPTCATTEVTKALMAPNITTSRRKRAARPTTSETQSPQTAVAVATATPERVAAERELVEIMRRIRRDVETNSENVGGRFAEEARKIHYDEAKPRGIYGEATLAEARDLLEEGIDVLPLPVLPEDKN